MKPTRVVVEIEDDGFLPTRRPSRLRAYVSTDDWQDFRPQVYSALRPIFQCRLVVSTLLVGVLVVPLLSFLILFIMVQTDFLELREEDDNDDDLVEDSVQEHAFQFLLLVSSCGCVSLTLLTLVVASLARIYWIQKGVDAELVRITEELTDSIQNYSKAKFDASIALVDDTNSDISTFCAKHLRIWFLAWCYTDYVLIFSNRKRNDVIMDIPTSLTEGDETSVSAGDYVSLS